MTTKTSIYEEFLLAKDKEAYLESIKTTSEYKHLIVHHRLNNNKPLPDQYSKLTSTHFGDRTIALKSLLLRLEDPETSDEEKARLLQKLNDKYLHLNFNHQR